MFKKIKEKVLGLAQEPVVAPAQQEEPALKVLTLEQSMQQAIALSAASKTGRLKKAEPKAKAVESAKTELTLELEKRALRSLGDSTSSGDVSFGDETTDFEVTPDSSLDSKRSDSDVEPVSPGIPTRHLEIPYPYVKAESKAKEKDSLRVPQSGEFKNTREESLDSWFARNGKRWEEVGGEVDLSDTITIHDEEGYEITNGVNYVDIPDLGHLPRSAAFFRNAQGELDFDPERANIVLPGIRRDS